MFNADYGHFVHYYGGKSDMPLDSKIKTYIKADFAVSVIVRTQKYLLCAWELGKTGSMYE